MTAATVHCASCRLPTTLTIDLVLQRGYLCDCCAVLRGWKPVMQETKQESMIYERNYGTAGPNTVGRRSGEMSVKGAGWKRGCEFWLGLCCGGINPGGLRL